MTNSPDAVSGAATPAQQSSDRCQNCGVTFLCSICAARAVVRCYLCGAQPVKDDGLCASCSSPNSAELAATPEAQIPEREQVYVRTGLIRLMYDASSMDDYLATLESQLASSRTELKAMTEDRDLWRFEHEGDCPVQLILEGTREELAAVLTELAALRVERDRAWNEAIEHAEKIASSAADEYAYECAQMAKNEDWSTRNARNAQALAAARIEGEIARLARPIPAEKPG